MQLCQETRNLLLFFNINRYKGAFGGLVLSVTANRTNKNGKGLLEHFIPTVLHE